MSKDKTIFKINSEKFHRRLFLCQNLPNYSGAKNYWEA